MVAHARILLQIELLKETFFCNIEGSYVPNLVKIGLICPQITSKSCLVHRRRTDARHWTPDTGHRTDARVGHVNAILYSVQCYALQWTDDEKFYVGSVHSGEKVGTGKK